VSEHTDPGVSNDETTLGDVELLLGAGDDPELFAELYRRHVRAVLTWFTRRTGCAETAADLTAETFAAAFVARRRYEDRGAPVIAWLFGIARRQLGSYARRRRVDQRARRKLGIERTLPDADDLERIEQLADLEPWRTQVRAALAQLPEPSAEAVRLRVVDELPFKVVAARLDVSEGAARVRVLRALTTLEGHVDPLPS
jgi:RNA polymerase sigma-70 factor (ECF subfamily)